MNAIISCVQRTRNNETSRRCRCDCFPVPTSPRSFAGYWFDNTEPFWFDKRRPLAELAYFQAKRLGLVQNRQKQSTAGRPVVLGEVAFYLYNFLKGIRTSQGMVLKSCPRYNEASLANILTRIMSRLVTREEIRAAKKQLVHFELIEIQKNKNVRWGHQDRITKLRGGNHKLKWQDVFCPQLMVRHEMWKEIMEVHAAHLEEDSKNEQFNIDNLRQCTIRESVVYGTDHQWAIEVFKSVGVTRIDFFFSPNKGQTRRTAVRSMGRLLKTAITKERNLFGRPYRVPLIMLDEVKANELDQLRQFAFFCQETSPKNYQVWLRLPDDTCEEDRNSIRDRIIKRFNPDGNKKRMNGGSFGSLRWPDSINWKPEHNQFRVRIEFVKSGRIVSIDELDQAGLLAPLKAPSNVLHLETKKAAKVKRDYWRVLPDWEFFKLKKSGNRSLADAAFIWESLQRGFAPAEIKEALRKVSPKVQEEQSRRRSDYYLDHQIEYVLGKVNSGKVADVA